MKFYKKIDEILRKIRWKFEKILVKSWENSMKFWRKIGEVLGENFRKSWEQFGKKLWKNFGEILENVMKFWEKLEAILKKI